MQQWHDVVAIRDVIDRYAAGVDRRDWDLVTTCFTAECHADYGRSGHWTARGPLVQWLDEIHRDVGPTMHRITNHQVTVDGDTATATSYLDALLQVEHGEHDLLHVVASYHDQLVRGADGWQIADRRLQDFLWRRERRSTHA
jgi:3-phenylpropionate/cinnamic acid dioxygenase small subunit